MMGWSAVAGDVVAVVLVIGLGVAVVAAVVIGVLDGYGTDVIVMEVAEEEGTRMKWLQGQ